MLWTPCVRKKLSELRSPTHSRYEEQGDEVSVKLTGGTDLSRRRNVVNLNGLSLLIYRGLFRETIMHMTLTYKI